METFLFLFIHLYWNVIFQGGWEIDETMEEAALRETKEEAGVVGILENQLGKWRFKSKSQGTFHDAYMFPLLVEEQLDVWPEKNARRRIWVSLNMQSFSFICLFSI
ncbi:hypothetical protein CsSME_00054172 [Camellia sinensis var. sinensis]